MTKDQIQIGGRYIARVSGNLVVVRVTEIEKRNGYSIGETYKRNAVTRYLCVNENTGRDVVIKSAMKFRREV